MNYPIEWKTYTGDDLAGIEFGVVTDKPFQVDVGLIELVKQIRNRCNIFLAIQGFDDLVDCIPTLLEDTYYDCQQIMDDYCIVDAEDD